MLFRLRKHIGSGRLEPLFHWAAFHLSSGRVTARLAADPADLAFIGTETSHTVSPTADVRPGLVFYQIICRIFCPLKFLSHPGTFRESFEPLLPMRNPVRAGSYLSSQLAGGICERTGHCAAANGRTKACSFDGSRTMDQQSVA